MRAFFTFCLLTICFSASAATRTFSHTSKFFPSDTNLPSFSIYAPSGIYSNVFEIWISTNSVFKVPHTNVSASFRSSVGIQSGSFTNQNTVTFTNAFSTVFSNAPIVTVTSSATNGWPAIDLITTTGFAGSIARTNLTTNYWTAIGWAVNTP